MSFFTCLLLIFVLLLIVAAIIRWYTTIPSNLPPGPLGLPFVGNMFQTWKASEMYKNLIKWTSRYGPVYKLYIAEKLVIILSDYDSIYEAFVKQGDTYSGRPLFYTIFPKELSGGGFNVNGETWKTQRRFALSTLRDLGIGRPIIEPRIKDEAEYLLEEIGKTGASAFDPAPLLSNAVSNVVCALVFGRRFQYEDAKFRQLLTLMRTRLAKSDASFLSSFVLSEYVAAVMKHIPEVKRLHTANYKLMDFIKDQTSDALKDFHLDKGDEPNNYIQAFYKAQRELDDNATFTDAQLIGNVVNLFLAGTDTTSTTLRWAIFIMAHNPEIQERVYEEIRKEIGGAGHSLLDYAERNRLPLTEAAIMETQRIANLVPLGVMRKTMAPSKLYGYDIPAGTTVVPVLTAVHYDPKIYPNPEIFDPNRFLNANKTGEKDEVFTHLIPFQIGKRLCLGEALAKMELFTFFTALMSRYRFYFPHTQPKPPFKAQVAVLSLPINFKVCAERRLD